VIRNDVLPDDVLLEIFDFYVKDRSLVNKTDIETWHTLVHVCRRWRSVVFESPHRLNLRLCCTPKTPSRDTLDVWPALPLLIKGRMSLSSGTDNIVVALGRSNRVCQVDLWDTDQRQLEKVFAVMQVPFPELIVLWLESHDETPPVIPDSFLGGSAPPLRLFHLNGISFPGLPKLLFSAAHLVKLELYRIPHSGYISPRAMVALLSVLSSLKTLHLQFLSPQSRPDLESQRLPPKCSVIPSLTEFSFKGVSEYLEDLVTCIDVPQLGDLGIIFFNQIDYETPRLAQFITRTPKFSSFDKAKVLFEESVIDVELMNRTHESGFITSRIGVLCREQDWQLSSIVQVCNSSLPPLSMVEDICIEHPYSQLIWKDYAIENTLWLELLLPFTAVKSLYLSKEFAPGIAAALEELVGGRITEILPSLQNIFVQGLEPWGPFHEHIGQFIAARRLSGRPVAISVWK
jgi:hypothetical protein